MPGERIGSWRHVRGPAMFRERDLKAAIRAARAAGEQAFSVEIATSGEIRVIVSPAVAAPATVGEGNPWDEDEG